MKLTLIPLAVTASLCATLCSAQGAPAQTPAAGAALAKTPAKTVTTKTPDPAARSNALARTGGIIQTPPSGPSFLFLNAQKRVPAENVRAVSQMVQRNLRLSCAVSDKPSDEPVAAAVTALADTNTAAVIVIGDSAGYPALLIAPESRWALVNVAALGDAGTSPELWADRVQKETWRAFGFLMGAAHSSFEHCLLKPVLTPADLDALKPKSLCPEPYGKILVHAQKLGMKPVRITSYRKAVEEGWAPAPTNDFQRAIWQELSKAPAK